MATYEVHYIGAKWCNACHVAKPGIQTVAQRFQVPIQFVDYDDDMSEDQQSTVTKLPTVRVYSSDTSIATIAAEFTTRHVESLESWLKTHVRVKTDEDF